MNDRKCLELVKTLSDPTITEAACKAFRNFNPPKCKECEWGGNEKAPLFLPEIIAQDSQISTITPETGQSTSETTKTILRHSGKPKGKIEGLCQRRGEELVWNACLQRKHRGIGLCESCNPEKEFQFSEQPMGQGWHNSAARAGEMVCPELDGRKLKKSICIMRQGKKRKAGKSCDCQYWEGGKTVVILCQKCSDVEVKRIGDLCLGCEAEANRIKEGAKEAEGPMAYYFCPTPYCANKVEVEGMRCGECQIIGLKQIERQGRAERIKSIAIPPILSDLICRHKELTTQRSELDEEINAMEKYIVGELQKAVQARKEVKGE